MNLDFSTLYALWATDFFQKNEILLLCFGVIILLLLVIMIVVSINKTKRLKTLQQLNEVAEESNQLKNAFIANMTHEIRTPLNAIVGFTNVLAETDNLSREERMIFLKEINDNKNFLVQMINDLLDFSKIEANTMEYKDGDVDVNALIQEICAAENAHPRPSGIQIEFVEKLPQCRLMIDRVRFAQVINNLVKNALKFTEQGSVRIGYRRLSNDSFYFYVADTGCGIDEESRRAIFERFVKMNYNIRGTGLGLSITKSIVEHYGGGIGVESKKGRDLLSTLLYLPVQSIGNMGNFNIDVFLTF